MKKTIHNVRIGFCFILLGLVCSCVSSQSFLPVKGNGISVDKNFSVSGINGIDVSGGFDVILSQGSSENVTLSAQENLYDYIHVEVVNGILKVYTEGNVMPTRPLKAMISFKNIDQLKVSGGGDVTSETGINAAELGIEISGGGDLTTSLNADNLKCHISGGGDARIKGSAKTYYIDMTGGGDLESILEAGSVNCNLSGGGDLTLECDKEATDVRIEVTGGGDVNASMNTAKLICSISGGGDASLKGKANEIEININGGGDVNASSLASNLASIHASGGSDIHVNVAKELNGNISGGGDIYYSGAPEIVSIDAKGGSKVHRE